MDSKSLAPVCFATIKQPIVLAFTTAAKSYGKS